MFRFLHTSDLHLGKPFGRFDEETRVRLREARHAQIGKLADLARARGASHILVAGDTFDAETPPPRTVRQALQAMADADDIEWVLMPGNHDSLSATDLWQRVGQEAPSNLVLAMRPEVIALREGVAILPAPPTVRDPGRDLSAWMEGATTAPDVMRIGIAHGGVQDFGSDEVSSEVIPPDKAQTAGLDYLALGDWHGRMKIGDRCWYSGTPEGDNFKNQSAPGCLLVACGGPGKAPLVEEIETGQFSWCAPDLDLQPDDDVEAELEKALPSGGRRDVLVQLNVSGRLGLGDRAKLVARMEAVQHDFAHFERDLSALELDQDADDLDDIASSGALRSAAEALFERAQGAGDDRNEDSDIAGCALARLYQFAREIKA